jgi:uncharacterized protein with LGFP repeats
VSQRRSGGSGTPRSSCGAAVSWRPPSQRLTGESAGAMEQANPALRPWGRMGERQGWRGYPAGRERLNARAASVVYRAAV